MTGQDRRRHDDEFKEKMLCFMSRVDQRNMDKDIQSAAKEEALLKIQDDIETRVTSLEHSRTTLKTIYVGVPALGGFAAAMIKLAHFFSHGGK